MHIRQSNSESRSQSYLWTLLQWMPGNWMESKLKLVIQCSIVGFWHHHYLFLNNLSLICDTALNISITLDHYKNMYTNNPTSLLPCLAPHYLLLAHTERRLGSFTQDCSSKKASHEKDPPQYHQFTSLYILAMHGVFSGVRG